MNYDVVIGVEVHIELATDSKIFCACPTKFGSAPNTQCCPVCAGLPGALPVLNERVVEYAVKLGFSTNCKIARKSKLDRKNYFYPDLPKAYQISQFDQPLCKGGYLDIETPHEKKRIGITRIHIEEDAGKLVHEKTHASVDMNRCCVPLVELVSEPDLGSAEEVRIFLENIKAICEYTGISDCKMQEGSLRCDVNLSLKPKGSATAGTRTETKNLNSFRAVVNCIHHEIERQKAILERGGLIIQQSRRYDDQAGQSYALRNKEDSHDYRYFPDPDLVDIILDEDYISRVMQTLPELPQQRKERYMSRYSLSQYDASQLTASLHLARFFESVVAFGVSPKLTANLILGELLRVMNEKNCDFARIPISAQNLAELIGMVEGDEISSGVAKRVFEQCFETGQSPSEIVEQNGLKQISNESYIRGIANKMISDNPASVQDYQNGKQSAFKHLIGQCMKASGGKCNPKILSSVLQEMLERV